MNRLLVTFAALSALALTAVLVVNVQHCLAQPEAQAAPATNTKEPRIADLHVGFSGDFKLGCWTTIDVEILGGTKPYTGQIVVTVPDSDGIPTSIATPADRPVGIQPGQYTTARLLARVGQNNSPIEVKFIADGVERCQRKFHPGPELSPGIIKGGLPSTNRLVVEFGPSLGLGDLVINENREDDLTLTRFAKIENASDFPSEWFGYEAVDTVLLTTSEPEIYRPLLQNPGRIEALKRWIEMGGRVVIFCGSEGEELLREDGPLAKLIPGKFSSLERLRQSHPLENFSSGEPITAGERRLDLQVSKLAEVSGEILVYAGNRPSDLPLVVRSRLGLGELVFVGLDFNLPPLSDWTGRTTFLQKVLDWQEQDHNNDQLNQNLAAVTSLDMVGKLRYSLDNKFTGIEVVSFAFVAFLVLGYIVLIGPGDYYLVRKIFGKPELTWITFPIIVVAVSTAAYVYANWTKGDQLRVNQVEVVDVDTISNKAKGTVWSHFFTPQVDEYNLSLQPRLLNNNLSNIESQVSWLGLPGRALGGMQTNASQTSVFSRGYGYDASRTAMIGLPVQVWSTKTIAAHWSAKTDSPLFNAELKPTADQLLSGNLTNNTGKQLEDCLLLYNHWAYHLGPVADGSTMTIDHSRQPRTVKTMLTSAMAGDQTITDTADDGTVPFEKASEDITRLMKTMMFFKAINGRRYTGAYNRYQSSLDLSHLLKQSNCAILVAKSKEPSSQWFDESTPLSSEADRHWTFYRFVLPVEVSTE